mmetsp:Transcript_21434/g.31842  ORF Transcript_21434/g.31842 Transcript_21434/m.31842 type:complete len:85 (-) Transcript_21434:883-1137(-)
MYGLISRMGVPLIKSVCMRNDSISCTEEINVEKDKVSLFVVFLTIVKPKCTKKMNTLHQKKKYIEIHQHIHDKNESCNPQYQHS